MLKNNKSVIFDLVIIAGPAGYFLLMTQINAGLGSLIKANIIKIYILLMEIRS